MQTDAERRDGLTSEASTEEHLSDEQVRRLAVIGVAVHGFRGIAIRLVGLVGTAVLARLLTPTDFGLVAFGATLATFASFLGDGGIGTALIRRAEPPDKADLRALLAFQLAANTALAAVIAAALLPFGTIGAVTAVMALSLPFAAFRTPAFVLLERRLAYRPLAVVEIVETAFFYCWAVATVGLGWGVWGFATASVVRTVSGSALAVALVPGARLRPSPSWPRVRRLLGFGLRYQGVGFTQMLRDQGVNLSVALFGGVAALGLWNVAYKILQVPFLLFHSLWQISFPGMSRLVAAGTDLRVTIERVIASSAVATGLILAPLAASAPTLVPLVLGEQWRDAALVIPPASLGLMIGGPVSVALAGYLWAVGDAGMPLRATLVGIATWAVVMLPLLPILGVVAVGIGWLVASVAEAAVLAVGARRHTNVDVVRNLARPTCFAAAATIGGWLLGSLDVPLAAQAVLAGGAAAAIYLLLLSCFDRVRLTDAYSLASRAVVGAAARHA